MIVKRFARWSRWSWAAPALLSAFACASTPDESEPGVNSNPPQEATSTPPAPPSEETTLKIAELTGQVELAKRKLDRARMDVTQQGTDSSAAISKATVERDLAQKALTHFDQVEMPQRLARAELDLKDASDQQTEQQEEMQQLELMYAKDDLADKTKEIVLARGNRRLERSKQRLVLAQKDYDDLKASQLPEQRTKLAQTLKEKEQELQRAQFAAETGKMDKETGVIAAQHELDKLQRELDKTSKQ